MIQSKSREVNIFSVFQLTVMFIFEREGRHREVLNNNNEKTRQHNNVYVIVIKTSN